MPACSPNRPSREILDRLIDTVAWAKTCMILTAATKPGSPERASDLDKLREAVIEPRRIADDAFAQGQSLPREVIIQLRTCELAIPQLEQGAVLRQNHSGESQEKKTP
jgi:hypothetical protein